MKQGWKTCKFADVFDLQMGKTPSRDNPTYWGDDNMWVSIADMNEQKYMSATKEGITDVAVQESGIKPIPKGTVIMSFKLSIGKVSIATSKLYTNEAIMGFIEKEEGTLVPEYLYYYLKGYKWEGANKAAMGMTLNKKTIAENTISYPPIAEQEKIVSELDCLSGIIVKKKQQLKELDNLAQSIFYEMFGDPVENDKGWEVKKIGEVCIVERGGSPRPINAFITDDENGVNWIKIGDATEGSRFITSTKEKIIPEGVRKSRMVYKGDFILSNSMSFGRPYIMGIDGCIHDGWLVLRDKDNVFDKTYLYYYLGSSHVYQEFKRLAVGGVVNNLNSELVRGVRVAIPSFSVQQDFASKIESIEKQKELIAQSIKETETLFNSRMDYYFN